MKSCIKVLCVLSVNDAALRPINLSWAREEREGGARTLPQIYSLRKRVVTYCISKKCLVCHFKIVFFHVFDFYVSNWLFWWLLQHVSIACYAERCISYDRFCPTVWPSDRLSVTVRYHAKTIPPTIMHSSLEDSPMTLVSWRLISPRNSEGNIGNEGAEWERGSKNRQLLANKSPYLENGAR